ncbi:unnamed protein product [Urochloa humidicola]
MAEFALGLTKTAVDATLSRVKSAIEEEAKLKEKVQQDLVFITGEFQMMQSFLSVASKERAKNEVVRTWVRQLRDLAFDVEDCVEFVVHLDKNSAWWWRAVPSCVVPPRALDEAAAQIRQLKARVEDVSQRNTRYSLISDSGSHSSKSIMAVEQPVPVPVPAAAKPSAFPILRQLWEAAGKIRVKGGLHDLIAREGSDLEVISVWGSAAADLGTAAIFRKAYCDPKICQEFKTRAWVKLMHPFNPDQFLKSLLTQFYECSHRAVVDVVDRLGDRAELINQVKEHKYLVILEEVSTVVEWNAIKRYLPDNKNGSRIVVSTQDLGIALLCPGEPYLVWELGRFSDGQSLCAFSKKVSGRRSDMGELKWQIRERGVISVYGGNPSKSILIKNLYHNIMNKREEFDGIKFEMCKWIDVSIPFNRMEFPQRILQDNEITAVDHDLTEDCCKFLREGDYLIVIDGLQSTQDWDWIKENFISQPIKGCIIVITDTKYVAERCAEDEYRVLNCEDLMAEGQVFSGRREEAREWISNFALVGRKTEQFELTCTKGTVFSVWGIAGVGKSSLVANHYYRRMLGLPRAETIFPVEKDTKYSWVDVPHPFNLTEFSWRLLLDFHSDELEAKEAAAVSIIEGQDPVQGCRKFLREHECFLVLDGLQSKDEWDLIKDTGLLLSGHIRCTIIVITNEATVAKHCVDHEEDRVLNVKGLKADEAHDLLKKISWGNKNLTHEEMVLSKLLIDKCGGLPKVIAAVGKYCSSPRNKLRHINDHFMDTVQGFHSLKGLFSWMQSYFEACNDSLKPCIFYLSVFPANHNIRRTRLLRRWIAEGYSKDSSSGTMEENGERLFSELVKLSIIQQQPSSMSSCRVNGFFHEYIISRPMEDNLVFALEGQCSLNSQRVGQHLTIRKSWDRDINVFESIDLSRLRSLTVFGEWRHFFIPTNRNMRLLRVLDLEDTSNVRDDDLEHFVKLLPRLKFLSLRGCTEVTRLPNSLSGMRQLQILDVRDTSIATLPQALMKLQKLRYVRAGTSQQPWDEGGTVTTLPTTVDDKALATTEDGDGTRPSQQPLAAAPTETQEGTGINPSQPATLGMVQTLAPSESKAHILVARWLPKFCGQRQIDNRGVKVPTGIGKLVALHTLGVLNASGEGGVAILKELKKLTQLRKLGLCGINRENWMGVWSAISALRHLESLSVQVDKDKEQGFFCCLDDTIFKPPKTIKSLKLYGYVHILPGWIMQLDNLRKLDLEMIILKQQDMRVFDDMPLMWGGRLCVKPMMDGDLKFKDDSWSLEVLEIECTSRLHVSFGNFATHLVKVLKVYCSSGSSFRISGLEKMWSLEEVWLKGSYSDALKQDLQQQLSKSYKKEKPVLKVNKPLPV